MSIGRVIATERKKIGLSQSRLAKKLHIGRSTLGAYERDERLPDLEVFIKLMSILGISSDRLLDIPEKRLSDDLEIRFMEYLRSEEELYKKALDRPSLEIKKWKNLS